MDGTMGLIKENHDTLHYRDDLDAERTYFLKREKVFEDKIQNLQIQLDTTRHEKELALLTNTQFFEDLYTIRLENETWAENWQQQFAVIKQLEARLGEQHDLLCQISHHHGLTTTKLERTAESFALFLKTVWSVCGASRDVHEVTKNEIMEGSEAAKDRIGAMEDLLWETFRGKDDQIHELTERVGKEIYDAQAIIQEKEDELAVLAEQHADCP